MRLLCGYCAVIVRYEQQFCRKRQKKGRERRKEGDKEEKEEKKEAANAASLGDNGLLEE